MASIKVILKSNKPNKKTGEAPLYMRIIKDRSPKYYSLGVKLRPEQWDEEAGKVRKNHPNSTRINFFLATKKAEAEGKVLDMELKSPEAGSGKIKERILGLDSISFFAYSERYCIWLESAKKVGTLGFVRGILRKVRKYTQGEDLKMEQITVSWLKDFENWMRRDLGNKDATVYGALKTIRRIMNEAVREDHLPIEQNPFYKMKLKTGKSEREFLTEDQIAALENLDLKPGSISELCRDMYVFACYACGVRIGDLLEMQWKNYNGEKMAFTMGKTKYPITFKIPNRAKEILEKYKTEGAQPEDFIFPVLPKDYFDLPLQEAYQLVRRKNTHINQRLKVLAKKIGVNHNMSIHTARHTWATRALRKGMRIEYVSNLLGHTEIKTTQIYAKIVNEDLDKAMDIFDE